MPLVASSRKERCWAIHIRTTINERTFAQNFSSSMGSPSMISSGEVTSKGSCRASNGVSEVTGRAILPSFDVDNPYKTRLRRALVAIVTTTGNWNTGM